MTMMISKFHKLIGSRLFWILILIVIIFSFVIWAMPWPAREEMGQEVRTAGKLFEEEISHQEFRSARSSTYLAIAMMIGQPPRLNDRMNEELERSAWRRLGSLKLATQLGLSADNNDVRQAIQSQPLFQDEQSKQFNPQRYQNFVAGFLRQLGMTGPMFEEYIRQEIILQQLRSMVDKTILVAPFEIQRTFNTINDVFDISYVRITDASVADDIDLSLDDINTYFEAHVDEFTIPPSVSVNYVRFPIDDFIEEDVVTEEMALEYYNDNIADYTQVAEIETEETTDDADAAVDAMQADLDTTDETIVTPFADVQKDIVQLLTRNEARNKAAEKATDMVLRLSNTRDGKAMTFAEAAEFFNLPVLTTEPFTLSGSIDDIDAGADFYADAFELLDTDEDYFSNAILGEDYVYVEALNQQYPSRTPLLSEVLDEVTEAAEIDATITAMSEKANAFQEQAAAGLEDHIAFQKTAFAFGLSATTLTNLSVLTANDDNALVDVIIPNILTYNQGEVSDPFPAQRSLIVAYVASRKPSPDTSIAALRPQIIEAVKRERRPQVMRDWEDFILQSGNFENNLIVTEVVTEEDEPESEAVDG